MKKILLGLLSLVTVGQFALAALPAGAQNQPIQDDPLVGLEATEIQDGDAVEAGKGLPLVIGRIIRTILGLLGIIFVVLMVYAGFLWMTARGETEPVEKAVSIIKQSVIGVVIIFLAYALTGFVINAVVNATGN